MSAKSPEADVAFLLDCLEASVGDRAWDRVATLESALRRRLEAGERLDETQRRRHDALHAALDAEKEFLSRHIARVLGDH